MSIVTQWQYICSSKSKFKYSGEMTEDKSQVNEQLENETPDLNEAQEESASGKKETKKDKAHKKSKTEEQLEKAEYELLEFKDKHIRLQAEFDNYRKRTLKERMELLKTASESLLIGILPVIDDFDRAMQTLDLVEEDSHVKDGVKLIYNKFQEFLKQNGVREIEAKGQNFDTDLHEAIIKIPVPTEELKGKVVEVVQKGYYLNDKVIRFSKVVIGE
jgi:molecular chaperone GrpE